MTQVALNMPERTQELLDSGAGLDITLALYKVAAVLCQRIGNTEYATLADVRYAQGVVSGIRQAASALTQ